MAIAAGRLRAAGGPEAKPAASACVIASTDADTVVAPDWLARTRAAIERGAQAVGGRIALDPVEAAALGTAVLEARALEAGHRLASVRRHAPDAAHHHFSGASLALTLAAYDAVGGLPRVACLEDEALERALRAAGIPVTYAADVRVETSARTDGHVPRGLAQVLRTAAWRAGAQRAAAQPTKRPSSWACVPAGAGARGAAVRGALDAAADDIVLVLGPGVAEQDAAPLASALLAGPGLQLVRAAEPHPDPVAELVARPALNLYAPELAVLSSPLTRTWAARRSLLQALTLPDGDAVDLTVVVDTWARHGLHAIAEHPVACPAPEARADAPLSAYELLAALATRFPGMPASSSAYSDPAGTRRARLEEHPPRASREAAAALGR